MTLYIRKAAAIADGSVTEAKLASGAVTVTKIGTDAVTAAKIADSAVALNTATVTGELASANIADAAITEAKLNALAVSTGKLADNAITLAKAHQALKIGTFVGDETSVDVTGTTETEEKSFKIVKSSSTTKGIQAQKLHVNAEMKTSNVSHAAYIKLYVNAEGTARITLSSTSTSFEMQEGDADISDLTAGAHEVHVKLYSADAGETCYNDLIEIFLEK